MKGREKECYKTKFPSLGIKYEVQTCTLAKAYLLPFSSFVTLKSDIKSWNSN